MSIVPDIIVVLSNVVACGVNYHKVIIHYLKNSRRNDHKVLLSVLEVIDGH